MQKCKKKKRLHEYIFLFTGEKTEGLGEGKGPSVDGITGFRAGSRESMLEAGRLFQQKGDEKSTSRVPRHPNPVVGSDPQSEQGIEESIV